MSISARELTILVQGVCYLIFAISAARQFMREPGQVRFHTLLIFGSATGTMVLIELGLRLYMLGIQQTISLFLLRLSAVCALFAIYAFFLLAGDLTNFRRWLGWVGIGMLVLGGAFTLIIVSMFPTNTFIVPGISVPVLALVLFPVLFGSFLFLAIRFWYASLQSSGTIRRRLQWLGASTTLACLTVSLAFIRFFIFDGPFTLAATASVLLAINITAVYVGCAPPGWLRRFWLLPELEYASRFCNALLLGQVATSDSEIIPNQLTPAITRILQYSMNGFGGLVGIVQLWNAEQGALEVAASILPSEEGFAADAKSTKDEALADVFMSGQALLRPISARKWPFLQRHLDSGMVLAAPLWRGKETLGVIGVCCEHAPCFNEGDLQRLQLFADQITCLLTCHAYQAQATALKTLRSEQALKDEFIAVIAHDLRTPLTVLKGRLQLLRRQLLKEGQPDAAEVVAKLDTPYTRLSHLISMLHDVSYIDTGRLQLLRSMVELVGLVRKVVETSSGREITLEIDIAPGHAGDPHAGSLAHLIVQADAGRVEQVLENLLDNARKYSPVESKITVRVERQVNGVEVVVSVRDEGIGIAPLDQPHLFERWFRPASGPGQTYSRPGLGLYISHEIVNRHGGRLWVESSGVSGEGSTFFFTLPLHEPPQKPAPFPNQQGLSSV
jgi:signal transduction histidine kinase